MDSYTKERIGVSICQEIFTRAGFLFREQQIMDYGVDAIIETKTDNYTIGNAI